MRLAALPLLLLAAPPAAEQVWRDFEQWVQSATAATASSREPVFARYAQKLEREGVAKDEIARRVGLINEFRLAGPGRQRVYYDAVYKFGGGPEEPIRYLVDAVRESKPGTALDVGMGNGRNGLYLASRGWRTTGYDISTEGLRQARERAAALGVGLTAVEASHDTFAWGRDQWDLVVVSYATMWRWDERLNVVWQSLRPGGVIVCDHECADALRLFYERRTAGFRLLHYRDGEELNEGWGMPNARVRRVQALIRKEAR